MKNWILIALGAFVFVSCNNANETPANSPKKEPMTENVYSEMGEGFRIMESSCLTCHNPNAEAKNKIAPSFTEIKKAYIKKSTDLESFTALMVKFMADPSQSNSVMRASLEQYGLMPNFNITPSEAKNLATYFYFSPMEELDWDTKYFLLDQENFRNPNAEIKPIDLGKKYAMQTKAVLGKNLKGAIKTKGVVAAVSFCNTRAYELTDSTSRSFNVRIKRVSDQPRNTSNQANAKELAYIKNSKRALSNGGSIEPQMHELNGEMVGYYPIITNGMCLQCHGIPEQQIKPKTLRNIQALYPSDLAIGYAENELRGIWVVNMDGEN
jgi:mono/diheme cytochrome c family protein